LILRPPTFVLAHVLVHEITHILQGIDRHSESGVMKSPGDYVSHRPPRRRCGPAPES
jgi:hypothetical protein